ncbi:ABC transporter ATP-binding protein, partial [Cryobacterium sp. MLB-32]|uniref:ATP-binding cassette domain-containing protein n=1 Tax=Cryobacterium sp. MLB-32 TaxID=1529318 RepID=UPI0004E772F3
MTTSAISTTALSRTFGTQHALADLTLDVPRGEIFGLLGHNGAGKTTTVNLLTTLLEPTTGDAVIHGHSVTKDAAGVRESIGYLPENVQFYDNLTLLENLRFFARLSGLRRPDARIHDVLGFLDFTDHDNQ